MRRALTYILSVLCLVSCIKERQTGVDLAIGDSIPDFSITTNEGYTVTGEDLREGVSVIMFFTTACSDCRETLPHIQRIYDEYKSHEVSFAIISREDSGESVSRYWSEQGYTMPYSAQSDRRIYELFAKTRVPRVYVCSSGVIKAIFTDDPNPTYEVVSVALDTELQNL